MLFHNLLHDNAVNAVPESELATKLRQLMLAAPSSGPTPSTAPVDVPPPPPPKPSTALPTDAYREEILQQIERDRVTIIHGETGYVRPSALCLCLLNRPALIAVSVSVSASVSVSVTCLLTVLMVPFLQLWQVESCAVVHFGRVREEEKGETAALADRRRCASLLRRFSPCVSLSLLSL